MLQLVILDCDGVMFSSKEANRHHYNDLLRAFSCPPMTETDLDYVHMHNVHTSVRYIFRHHTHVIQHEVNEYCAKTDYTPYLRFMIIEPHLLAFLKRIKTKACTAISTNRTDTMDAVLDTFQLRALFDMVVTATKAPRPKPAPDALYMILTHFQLPAASAIYIGDSKVDEEHCAGTGIPFVAFQNPTLKADYYVSSFAEVERLPPFQELLAKEK